MVSRRAGHTLAELVVAITFLGATLSGLAAAALVGARWTRDAVLRQEALAVATATLDSLLALPAPPDPGGREAAPLPGALAWAVSDRDDGAAVVEVEVRLRGVAARALVRGLWSAPPPLLDDGDEGEDP